MDTKLILIVSAIVLIFALEGVFPYYRDRTARVRHAIPHLITAIMNGLLTKFFLAGLTTAAIAWAESKSLGVANALSLPAVAELIFVFVLFDIWMYW